MFLEGVLLDLCGRETTPKIVKTVIPDSDWFSPPQQKTLAAAATSFSLETRPHLRRVCLRFNVLILRLPQITPVYACRDVLCGT